MATTSLSSLHRLGALAVLLSCIAGVLVIYALHAGMKHNPIQLPFERAVDAQTWIPEGWKFFTRDAREERISMFVKDGGVWKNAARTPNANPRNAFGLDRLGRAQGVELGLIASSVEAGSWQPCNGDTATCFDSAPAMLHVKNISPSPSLCGEVGLISQQPLPWAWAHDGLKTSMPTTFVRLEVQC